jgi:uncharacterized small protein (DUF1192 family)
MSDIISLALKRYQDGIDADRDNRDRDEEDRLFFAGQQWNRSDLELRRNRPTLTINRMPQFVKQVTGEMRQNKPAIRILPVDEQTDPELAKVYGAVIRHIETRCDAHRAYAKAGEQAVIGGIGWLRILTNYADDTSFDQEIEIVGVRNPLSVVIDPNAIKPTREDMEWAFVVEELTLDAFRDQYPNASLTGFPVDETSHPEYRGWVTQDKIRVAEYWVREPYQRTLFLLSDGSTRYDDDEVSPEQMALLGITVAGQRKVTAYKVKCYKLTAMEVLEEFDWEGQHIPIVPVIGEEVELGSEVFRHGLVYHAKDGARSYNFARSAMMEHVASQPKAPYLATAAMLKNHKSAWERLNVDNPPVLLYDTDPSAPGGAPRREAPPTMASAWYQEALIADNDMKATTGIYDSSLGAKSNETSGVAIRARQSQGDTGTFVYIDHLTAAIKQIGRILLEIIPRIYTGERVVRIIGEDDAIEGFAKINGMLPDGTVFNDISQGQFDLEVTTGPAFASKRQEMLEYLMQLVQAVPAVGQVAGDIIVKSLDMPNGDKLAERVQLALLPPGIDEEVDMKRAQATMRAQQLQQQMTGPQEPDPVQVLTVQELEAKVAKLQAEAAKIQASIPGEQAKAMKDAAAAEQTQVETSLMPGKVELEAIKTGFGMGS